jgi:hypothetical protein
MDQSRKIVSLAAAAFLVGGMSAGRAEELSSLEGVWILDAAYEIQADGTQTTNYGEHPKGLLTVDTAGRS